MLSVDTCENATKGQTSVASSLDLVQPLPLSVPLPLPLPLSLPLPLPLPPAPAPDAAPAVGSADAIVIIISWACVVGRAHECDVWAAKAGCGSTGLEFHLLQWHGQPAQGLETVAGGGWGGWGGR